MPLDPLQEAQVAEALETTSEAMTTLREWAIQYGARVAGALAILVIGWFAARFLTGSVRKALVRANVDATLARFLCNVARMLAMTFVGIAAIDKVGVETTSFVAVLGAAGFAVGFALQGSLSNLAAGVMIMAFRPFKAGDEVEAGGTSGVVKEVGIFSSVFLTNDNKRVIVSNSAVTGNVITNYSSMSTRRVDMEFDVSYGEDLEKVRQLLLDVLKRDARVLATPATLVLVGNLGESAVRLHCQPWVRTADFQDARAHFLESIKRAFDEGGITFPCPQRDVRLHQVA